MWTADRQRGFSPFRLILRITTAGVDEGITLTLSPVRLGRNPHLAGT